MTLGNENEVESGSQPPRRLSSKTSKISIEAQQWSGPLPAPDHLQQYEIIVPGAGDRILSMAEKEQNHRHSQGKGLLRLEAREQRIEFVLRLLGSLTWVAVLAIGLAFSFQGQQAPGLIMTSGAGLAWVVIGLLRVFRNNDG